ncbi:helix-turn-helix domain-containing protein [Paenibacillus antibioticophila]|uniref:helix-turn-helix domain-containing protein n=1 Tax=Paenibacillus antibioticophila TaxID=1274374 RepID=UPI0005C83DC0|nr:helix-turn-helix transcriptional regulator [Paenibacillus antibioticophila]
MKEINIAHVLVSKRKEKGITQDDLAQFIGVSKTSVSNKREALQRMLNRKQLQAQNTGNCRYSYTKNGGTSHSKS